MTPRNPEVEIALPAAKDAGGEDEPTGRATLEASILVLYFKRELVTRFLDDLHFLSFTMLK